MGHPNRIHPKFFAWALCLAFLIFPNFCEANDCRWWIQKLSLSEKERINHFITDLKNESPQVRWRAVKAIVGANDAKWRSRLIPMLADSDARIRDEVTESLKSSKDDSLFADLTKSYQTSDTTLRRGIIESLWKIHDERALPLLTQASQEDDSEVRWFAALALGDLKDSKGIPFLIKRLSDTESRVQWVATRALVKFQDPRLASFLIPMLGYGTTEVQTSAAWAMGELRATELIFPLEMALENQDFQVRWAAAEALGKMNSPEAFEPLLKAIEDEDEYVQSQAIKSLARIKDPRAITLFKDLLYRFSSNFNLQTTTKESLRFLKTTFEDDRLQKQIDLILLNFDFRDQIEHLTGIQLDRTLLHADESTRSSFNFLISSLQKDLPHLIPEGDFDFLWDQVKKLNSATQLLQLYFQESLLELEKTGRDLEIPKDSLSLLERSLGISLEEIRSDQKMPKSKISKNALGQFYELALDLALRAKDNSLLRPIRIDDIANKRRFTLLIDILSGLRDLTALRSQEKNLWPRIRDQIDFSISHLDDLSFQIQRVRFEEIQVLFGKVQPNFDLEKIEDLSRRWGDLRPIFTLLSRYRGEINSEAEIEELYNIFDAVLKDRFFEYKFEGDRYDDRDQIIFSKPWIASEQDVAKDQLSPLKSSRALSGWTKIRNQLHFYDQLESSTSIESRLQELKAIVETNLLHHVQSSRPPQLATQSLILKSLEQRGTYEEKWRWIQSQNRREISSEEIFHAAALEMLLAKDFFSFKKIHALLKNWIKMPMVSMGHSETLKSDIDEIDFKIIQAGSSFRRTASSAQGFVFTTTVQDAKSLLMIGSCVRGASSCQNYQTGTHIQSLLGYVKDAHVQATLSFFVNAAHFSRAQDYQALVMANQEGQILHAEFLPESFRIRFFWGNQEVVTDVLDSAQRRHVLKLGKMEAGLPGLFLERAYKVNHPAQSLMESQTNQILNEMATETGGRIKLKAKGSPLRVAASRHLSGHYSDAAGGPQRQAYIIR